MDYNYYVLKFSNGAYYSAGTSGGYWSIEKADRFSKLKWAIEIVETHNGLRKHEGLPVEHLEIFGVHDEPILTKIHV